MGPQYIISDCKTTYVVQILVCEQAYSMAQNLDPNSDGRGVLQFKTGLMSLIKVCQIFEFFLSLCV